MSSLASSGPVDVVSAERPAEVLAVAGGLGLAFQWLFWDATPGLSAPIFVALTLAGVWWTARRQGIGAARSSVGLSVVAMVLATGVAVRAEPLTTVATIVVVLGLLAMLVHAFGSDRWLTYGLRDWALAALRLCGHEATAAPRLVVGVANQALGRPSGAVRGRVVPLLRGVALAVPVMALLAVLLASADEVFASRLSELTGVLPRPGEGIGRLVLALVVAYAAAGGLWHLSQRRVARVLGDQPVPKVLGLGEAATVLVGVNALLAGFVAIQLRYFFGGHEAVVAEGLTYAEYARRGFGELVVVAGLALVLHLALVGLTHQDTPRSRWILAALTGLLTGLVLVILVSAFQRLLLYEAAFGFTRLRIAVQVFMVWLGLLLACLLGLQLVQRVRMVLLAGMVAVVGFAATLTVIGVDGLIARHNVARATQGAELDAVYLQGLSADAVPELVALLPELDEPVAGQVAAVVGCLRERHGTGDWRSATWAHVRARAALDSVPDRHRVPCAVPRPAPREPRSAPPRQDAAPPVRP